MVVNRIVIFMWEIFKVVEINFCFLFVLIVVKFVVKILVLNLYLLEIWVEGDLFLELFFFMCYFFVIICGVVLFDK